MKNITKVSGVPLLALLVLLSTRPLFFSGSAQAGERVPTFFVDVGGGFYSYDSKFVVSKDTGTSSNYSLGINAGSSKNMSMLISSSSMNTAFELNESNINLVFQDTMFRYFWGPIYLGAAISQTNIVITRNTATVLELDAIGTGYGINLGGHFAVGKTSEVFLDASSVTTSNVKEVNKSVFAIGSRTDVTIGGKFELTRSLLRGIAAVTYRKFSLGLDGTSNDETLMMTRFGLAMNFNF